MIRNNHKLISQSFKKNYDFFNIATLTLSGEDLNIVKRDFDYFKVNKYGKKLLEPKQKK